MEAGRQGLAFEDPWEGFVHALWTGGAQLSSDRAFTEILAEADMPIDPTVQEEMNGIFAVLVHRAQAAGQLRADLVLDDIPMFMCGIGAATVKHHECPEAWRRHLSIIIDGLRARNASSALPR
jgi:hypothetical protein